jgi:membrane protein
MANAALFTVVFAGMYQYLPDAEIQWRDVWVGSAFTAVLFTAGKFALGLYLGSVDVAANFGAAGSLAVIMLWVYYASIILLLGAEFTQVWARTHGSPIKPEPGSIRFTYQRVEHRNRAAGEV